MRRKRLKLEKIRGKFLLFVEKVEKRELKKSKKIQSRNEF